MTYANPTPREPDQISQIDRPAIDRVVARTLRAWQTPGVAIAVLSGDDVYIRGYGVKELGKPDPVTPETLFAIASCTKAFTTTAMGILVDDGKMAWDDHVRKHVPGFRLPDPFADSHVTLRDLVSHRTGMPRHDDLWYSSPWERDDIIRRYGLAHSKHPFRTTFEYANIPFMVAGLAVESASGLPWAEFVRTRIFEPLGMDSANCSVDATLASPDHATPHVKKRGKVQPLAWMNLDREGPAGGINACASDMLKWLRMQLDGGEFEGKQVISAANLNETRKPHIVCPVENPDKHGFDSGVNMSCYCLGWGMQEYRGQIQICHGGYINGFTSQVTLIPRSGVAVAVLANTTNGPVTAVLANSIIDILLGLPARDWNGDHKAHVKAQEAEAKEAKAKESRHKHTRPSKALDAYAAVYEHPSYGTLSVTMDDCSLSFCFNGYCGKLKHHHFDVFKSKLDMPYGEATMKLMFTLSPDGEVASARILELEGIEFTRVKAK